MFVATLVTNQQANEPNAAEVGQRGRHDVPLHSCNYSAFQVPANQKARNVILQATNGYLVVRSPRSHILQQSSSRYWTRSCVVNILDISETLDGQPSVTGSVPDESTPAKLNERSGVEVSPARCHCREKKHAQARLKQPKGRTSWAMRSVVRKAEAL